MAAGADAVVTTDTLQRRQSSFATATDLYGPLLAADQDYPSLRAVHDYWPEPLSEDHPGLTDLEQTVRRDDGDARAVASSTLAEPALGQGREWRVTPGVRSTPAGRPGGGPLGTTRRGSG